jgi:hypothetical protein
MIRDPHRCFKLVRWSLIWLSVVVAPASATTLYHHDLDPDHTLFGNLKQTDVPDCGNGLFACGPTAAVNSFSFLQNKFPNIYDNKLIPDLDADGDFDYDDMKLTAVALGGMDYMMCAVCDGGTLLDKFEKGKRDWINEHAPGTTIFKRLDDPTWNFLYQEVWDMEDVELLFGFYNDAGARIGGHYVTLTKFWWEDTNMDDRINPTETAMIGFVDPADGTLKTQSLGQFNNATTLFTNYGVGLVVPGVANGTIAITRIDSAISESPIPEPAAFALAAICIGCVALRRRRFTG